MPRLTIKEAINLLSNLCSFKEAEILISYLLKKERVYLFLHENRLFEQEERLLKVIKKLKNNTPIEYITNSVSFYSKEFFIKEGALIPRPETELLIDQVVAVAQNLQEPKIAEIGVGSGVVSIMLAFLLDTKIVASDISTKAIEVAKINRKNFKLEDKIEIIHTPYLESIEQNFDIIVSNPPYIADDFTLDKKLYHEPKEALFGGQIGDEVLKNIIDISFEKEIKYLICEMGYDQKIKIENYLKKKKYKSLKFYRDLSDFDRGFILEI